VAGGEVVRAVENDICFLHQGIQAFRVKTLWQGLDGNFRIDPMKRNRRFVDLRTTDAFGAVEDLTLEVGEVDLVGIGERELADAARCEIQGSRASQAAGADDQRGCSAQPLLSLDPDLGKEDVAAVAEKLLVVQLAGVVGAGFVAATVGGCFTGSPFR
jgi:hypothetical protein